MKVAQWTKLDVFGPFDLAASAAFLEGFTPAARPDAAAHRGELRFAFPVAPSWRPVGVVVRQEKPDSPVLVRVVGDPSDMDSAIAHTRRILSLDVDGSGFADVGRRDPVVGELQRRYPGLRPVAFHSPYEAACWTIIGQRIRMVQAAAIKDQLARRLGTPVDVDGVTFPTFPDPATLFRHPRIPLVNEVKAERLRGVAEAALAGQLDADELRALPIDEALARLRRIPGIGPFSAELTLLRGAAHPDAFPLAEPRLHAAMTSAYQLADSTPPPPPPSPRSPPPGAPTAPGSRSFSGPTTNKPRSTRSCFPPQRIEQGLRQDRGTTARSSAPCAVRSPSRRALGCRAIVLRGWADLSLVDSESDCLSIGEVPQMYDQPYWAQSVHNLGIGTAYPPGLAHPHGIGVAAWVPYRTPNDRPWSPTELGPGDRPTAHPGNAQGDPSGAAKRLRTPGSLPGLRSTGSGQ